MFPRLSAKVLSASHAGRSTIAPRFQSRMKPEQVARRSYAQPHDRVTAPRVSTINWSTYLSIARHLPVAEPVVIQAIGKSTQQKCHYSTNQEPPKKGSSSFLLEKLQENKEQYKNRLTMLAVLLGFLYLLYVVYRENVKMPVVDKSVLRANDDDNQNNDLWVVDALTLKVIEHRVTSGRSHGHKVKHAHETEDHRYYYFKEPFDRQRLIKELVVGALGRDLFGGLFPRVFAVETPLNDLEDDSRYALISESLGEKAGNMNLEDWARLYAEDHIDYVPTHLGTSIAFDMLMGKTDCKLANLIVKKMNGGNCYSIDHETSLMMAPEFLKDDKEGLQFICEFSPKTLGEHIYEQNGDGAVDTETDNMHQPLRGNREVKNTISPVLRAAIRNDLVNGRVIAFYEKFANTSETDLRKLFTRFGSLIHADEQENLLKDLQARQVATRQYLAQLRAVADQEETAESSVRLKR